MTYAHAPGQYPLGHIHREEPDISREIIRGGDVIQQSPGFGGAMRIRTKNGQLYVVTGNTHDASAATRGIVAARLARSVGLSVPDFALVDLGGCAEFVARRREWAGRWAFGSLVPGRSVFDYLPQEFHSELGNLEQLELWPLFDAWIANRVPPRGVFALSRVGAVKAYKIGHGRTFAGFQQSRWNFRYSHAGERGRLLSHTPEAERFRELIKNVGPISVGRMLCGLPAELVPLAWIAHLQEGLPYRSHHLDELSLLEPEPPSAGAAKR